MMSASQAVAIHASSRMMFQQPRGRQASMFASAVAHPGATGCGGKLSLPAETSSRLTAFHIELRMPPHTCPFDDLKISTLITRSSHHRADATYMSCGADTAGGELCEGAEGSGRGVVQAADLHLIHHAKTVSRFSLHPGRQSKQRQCSPERTWSRK